jgi:vesicle coat complex subunit
VQYVALRNIDLLLQKQPDILSKEMRVFFCKYNDPPYLKLEKLEIMVRIANEKNVDQLLAELKEYAMEVDMDFVRRAVRAIGQVAIKIEEAGEKCVNSLLDLINTKVNYVVQEAIVVIKDIFRKYPGYEGIIPTLCQCIDELDEPNARAALIWIVGEYAEKISNAGDILASFVEGFNEEFTQVSQHASILERSLIWSGKGPTPDLDRSRQTLPQETRAITRLGTKSTPSCHSRERQPGYQRSSLRLLEITIFGSSDYEGQHSNTSIQNDC